VEPSIDLQLSGAVGALQELFSRKNTCYKKTYSWIQFEHKTPCSSEKCMTPGSQEIIVCSMDTVACKPLRDMYNGRKRIGVLAETSGRFGSPERKTDLSTFPANVKRGRRRSGVLAEQSGSAQAPRID